MKLIPKVYSINLMGEARSQESGIRSQESGVRSEESGVRNQESRIRNQESGKMGITIGCNWIYSSL